MTDALFQTQGAPYANFPSPGTNYQGLVTSVGQTQGRAFVPPNQRAAGKQGALEFWPDGRPKMVAIITVQTSLRDPSIPGDDGQRSVWIKGKSMTDAVKAAVRAAGAGQQGIVPGGWFSMTYTHDELVEGVDNAAKRYEVEYRSPAQSPAGEINIVGGVQAPAQAPQAVQQAPVATQSTYSPAPAQAQAAPSAATAGYDLSALPPEARAAVEAMMAAQGKS